MNHFTPEAQKTLAMWQLTKEENLHDYILAELDGYILIVDPARTSLSAFVAKIGDPQCYLHRFVIPIGAGEPFINPNDHIYPEPVISHFRAIVESLIQ